MAVRRLHLLRHAKSSWKEPELPDHDRPLAKRGRRAAKVMRRHLRERGIRPDLVLCSTAARARETLERLELDAGEVRHERELYAADAGTLLARLQAVPASVGSVLLVGHNPGLEDLAIALGRHEFADKFPTGALASLEFRATGWDALDRGTAELTAFVRPRDLE